MIRSLRVGLVAGLLIAADASAHGQAGDDGQSLTAPCYDPDRRIVQTMLRHECRGRIVSPEEAARIAHRLRLERARRAGNATDAGSGAPSRRAGKSFGSGFAITDAGHVLTARHVIESCARVDLATASGLTRAAEIHAVSPDADVALLHSSLRPRPFRLLTDPPDTETPLSALGYPNLGMPVIRPVARAGEFLGISERKDTGRLLVFKGQIRAGASGGPLVDDAGHVRGLVIAKVHTPEIFKATGIMVTDVNFALDSAELVAWLEGVGVTPAAADAMRRARQDRTDDILRVICHPARAAGGK